MKDLRRKHLFNIAALAVIAVCVGLYAYMLHTGKAQELLESIRDLELLGIVIGIAVQSLVNIIPVPGEFISVMLMEIYGPVWGGIYSWIGGIAGALGALYLTKWIGKPFFGAMAQPFLSKIDNFIVKHVTLGLLLVRFVPFLPYHLINYAAGLLNVKIWRFIWTTALGILPFTIAMSGIYSGFRHGSLVGGILSVVIFLILLGAGALLKKEKGEAPGSMKHHA